MGVIVYTCTYQPYRAGGIIHSPILPREVRIALRMLRLPQVPHNSQVPWYCLHIHKYLKPYMYAALQNTEATAYREVPSVGHYLPKIVPSCALGQHTLSSFLCVCVPLQLVCMAQLQLTVLAWSRSLPLGLPFSTLPSSVPSPGATAGATARENRLIWTSKIGLYSGKQKEIPRPFRGVRIAPSYI